jgi:hypothetical protein
MKLLRWTIPGGLILTWILCACGGNSDSVQMPRFVAEVSEYRVIREADGYSFFRPVGIAVDSPFVFVADSRDRVVTIFDPAFRVLGTLGRPGEGPGEFGSIQAISAIKDSLAVLEGVRVSLFGSNGGFRATIPVTVVSWGDIALTDRGSFLLATCDRQTDKLVQELDLEGNPIAIVMSNAGIEARVTEEYRVKVRWYPGQTYIVFAHEPRIVGIGTRAFDWSYDLQDSYPFLRIFYRNREDLRRRGVEGSLVLDFQGGFDRFDHYLIIAGPIGHLMVLDLDDGTLYPLSLGELADSIQREAGPQGSATFNSVSLFGDRVLLASEPASCLIEIGLSDIMDAVKRTHPVRPLPR